MVDRARYAGVAVSHSGADVITEPYAQIKLYVAGSGTPGVDDGTAISDTIYAANTGGTTLTNPFNADVDGNFVFYLDAARTVKLVATGPTIGTLVSDYEQVEAGPGNLLGAWVGESLQLQGDATKFGEATGTSSFKGGSWLTTAGSLMLGKQAFVGDVTTATLVVNRESTSRDSALVGGAVAPFGDEVMVNLDFLNRSKGSDSGAMTIHCGEGDIDGYNAAGAPGGPAGALRAIEVRARYATYTTIITRGHGGNRRGIGIGFQTQTASTSIDGTTANVEVGLEANFDGQGAFPALSTNPDGVMGDTCILTGGFNGAKWHLYGLKPGASSITDPVYAIDQYGRIGSNQFPNTTAQIHARRHGSVALTTDFIHLLESDNTSVAANQGRIRGETSATKHLDYGYNTTSNYGSIDATNGGAASPLLLNPTLGTVYVAPGASGGTGRLVVVGLAAHGTGTGIVFSKSGDSTKYGEMYINTDSTVQFQAVSGGVGASALNMSGDVAGIGLQLIRTISVGGPATNDLFQVTEGGVATRLNLSTAGLLNVANATPANTGYAVNGTKVVGARGSTVAAVAGTIPAGGTGTAAGGFDTAGNRDTFITTVTELKTQFNLLRAALSAAGAGSTHGLIP